LDDPTEQDYLLVRTRLRYLRACGRCADDGHEYKDQNCASGHILQSLHDVLGTLFLPPLALDRSSPIPLYEQLHKQLGEAIIRGPS